MNIVIGSEKRLSTTGFGAALSLGLIRTDRLCFDTTLRSFILGISRPVTRGTFARHSLKPW